MTISKPNSINMKKLFDRSTLVALTFLALFAASCSKSDDDNNNPTTNQASNIPPSANNADGVMVAIKTLSFIEQAGFEFSLPVNTAVAAFGNLETGAFEDVGTVDLGGDVLEKQSNNSYVYTFDGGVGTTPGETYGLDLNTPYTWNVTGGGGFGAFDHTVTRSFASIGKITSGTGNISSSSSYTLSVASVSGADSVYYQIAGDDGNVYAVTGGNVTSHTFTAAEVASVGSGDAVVQVAAINYTTDTKSGKDIWFLNETVVTDFVKVQ